jgi:AmiR/NasT family two-component response regulator
LFLQSVDAGGPGHDHDPYRLTMPQRPGAGDHAPRAPKQSRNPSDASSEPRTSDALRRLSAGFVHEVNNALNPVLAGIFLLQARAEDPAAVREIAGRLKATAEGLARQAALLGALLRPGDGLPAEATDPRASVNALPPADPVTRRQLAAAPTGKIRVLVADDAAGDRSLLGDLLTELGYDVVGQATTGEEAVQLATATRPDAVLLDVHMPGGSGIEAAERITQAVPSAAVVLFSGDGALLLSERDIASSSALAFLPKPAPPTALDGTVRLAVQRARELAIARTEASDAKRQLANRKIIERAKGALMKRMNVTEEEAYRFLQKTSQNRAVPIIEIAKLVLETDAPVDGK